MDGAANIRNFQVYDDQTTTVCLFTPRPRGCGADVTLTTCCARVVWIGGGLGTNEKMIDINQPAATESDLSFFVFATFVNHPRDCLTMNYPLALLIGVSAALLVGGAVSVSAATSVVLEAAETSVVQGFFFFLFLFVCGDRPLFWGIFVARALFHNVARV